MTKNLNIRQFTTVALLLPLLAMSFSVQAEENDKQRAISVTVNNTNANPVPVNGNVVVSGTANVNVTNTVPVMGNVGVTGTVSVGSMPTVTLDTSIPLTVKTQTPASFIISVHYTPNFAALNIHLPNPAILESVHIHCASDAPFQSLNLDQSTLPVPPNGVLADFWAPTTYGSTNVNFDSTADVILLTDSNVKSVVPLTRIELPVNQMLTWRSSGDCKGVFTFHFIN